MYNPDVEGGKERLTDKESISQSKSTSMAAQSDYVLTYINQFGDHGLTLTAGLTTNYNEYSDLSGGRSQLPGYGVSIGEDIDKWWITMIDDATQLLMVDPNTNVLQCPICSVHCITIKSLFAECFLSS